jgi:hypothetical protein
MRPPAAKALRRASTRSISTLARDLLATGRLSYAAVNSVAAAAKFPSVFSRMPRSKCLIASSSEIAGSAARAVVGVSEATTTAKPTTQPTAKPAIGERQEGARSEGRSMGKVAAARAEARDCGLGAPGDGSPGG